MPTDKEYLFTELEYLTPQEEWKRKYPEAATHYKIIEEVVRRNNNGELQIIPLLYDFYTSKHMFHEPNRSETAIVKDLCRAQIQPWKLFKMDDEEIVKIIGDNPNKLARIREVLNR